MYGELGGVGWLDWGGSLRALDVGWMYTTGFVCPVDSRMRRVAMWKSRCISLRFDAMASSSRTSVSTVRALLIRDPRPYSAAVSLDTHIVDLTTEPCTKSLDSRLFVHAPHAGVGQGMDSRPEKAVRRRGAFEYLPLVVDFVVS